MTLAAKTRQLCGWWRKVQSPVDRCHCLEECENSAWWSNEPALFTLRYNDDANGVIRMYSRDPRALEQGQIILVEERRQLSVELAVERTGE